MALPSSISAAHAHIGEGLPTKLIITASQAHPKPADQTFTYGTAGLRTRADILDSTCFRVGLIGALRSKKLKGKTIGLMVTASHNPEQDNGVKMVDPRGEMLEATWEPFCTQIANAANEDELIASLDKLVSHFKIDLAQPASVIVGYDTRPSCKQLVQAIVDGLSAFGAQTIDAGLKTTPQLHYLVKCLNTQGTPDSYGEPTEQGYYKKLAAAFLKLVPDKSDMPPLVVDCANGVGAYALTNLIKYLPEDRIAFRPLRTSTTTPGALNHNCGADFVKTNQCLPAGFEKENLQPGERLCSFDGDADRIVYYYLTGPSSSKDSFRLLDGDKIASLAAGYLSELVKAAGINLELGCVQTAYANGSSTKYLKQRVPVTCTPTGVKHLHHAAEAYDIGVYFEANGHGTVLFSPSAQRKIQEATPASPAAQTALEQLSALVDLINQTVGDALSDMLLVEVILRSRQWGPAEWDGAYEDLPNKILKVNVKDRFLFKTEDAERRLTSPAGLQERIDELVGKYKDARSFVRPSGTEDCVRVYAECAIASELAPLANGVAKLVSDYGSLA
ncbi:probable PCM1 - phosphoacetylglucosamine mutase [Ustilago trichophora]|uniref:Phosphoacetylglucosamine mutase n=1 Tax=Ustilago trichophora TaxID=86804 RepID=A0A5C3E140_9BASI|nr:probable PCM1 - phosphoacetylglucosamine mutase [Ustilago trichophora]